MADSTVPTLEPEEVRKLVRSMLENWILNLSFDEQMEARAVTDRLLSDKRMKWVWRQLIKRVRDPHTYEQTAEFLHKPTESPPMVDLYDRLATLLYRAVELVIVRPPIITKDEAMTAYAEPSEMETHLIEDAKRLRALNRHTQMPVLFLKWQKDENPNFPKREFQLGRLYDWTNLDDIASLLDHLAIFFRKVYSNPDFRPFGPSQVVDRQTADDATRAYVLGIARCCKACFGSPLYGTIAAISSVALNKSVKPRYVRNAVEVLKL